MNADHDPLAAESAPLTQPQDQCKDCQRFFPGGQLFAYPHGNICGDCHQQRTDTGLTEEAFGTSPRKIPVVNRVLTPVRLPNPALLGTPAQRDAFADEMLAQEHIRGNQP